MHPQTEKILGYFKHDHLPEPLYSAAAAFSDLAYAIATQTSGPETQVCLRKLLEAKDAGVRAMMDEKVAGT